MLDKALALARAGRTAEANALYEKLHKAKPRNLAVLRAVISFHNRYSRRFRRAIPAVTTLLDARPTSAEAHRLAAETYGNCLRLPLAQRHADRALELAPDDPDVLFIAAFVYMRRNDFVPAVDFIDRALSLRPDHGPSLLQRARALLGMGDVDGAVTLCRDLLAKNPNDINLIGLYVNASRMRSDDPTLIDMRDRLLPEYERIGGHMLAHLLKLLGKSHNDFGDYDGAFALFQRAKVVLPMDYDAKGYAGYVDTLCGHITRADYFGKGVADETPVLIVGMPRSGSTLLEQVLAGHPDVASAGESPSLNAIVQETRARLHHGGDMVRAIKQIPSDAAARLAQRYLDETAQGGAKRVLDKSLHNFELLGFFAAMLPRARIIHVMRDPMDTCTSCYMQDLSAWHRYTQNLDTLGHAYVQYRRLMAHWKTALPNQTLELRYEDLVTNTGAVARDALDFLELDWDPACLDFQNTPNQSLTLSARQVRAPLYTTSMQRWRRYEVHLGPLKRHLNQFYPDGV